ncbi:5-oxoprolinase subunit PxpB [Pontibacter ramchanderi]|uniref:Inhibitor of KinA n=1 Tax=Pontibacter ramchanderi TaxID=1179743 RepID=A0A2N3UAR7_9BACT|nr:5-oxoprolinase subunit PxpB [Pontibacter ramchanderi]PKV66451.1 inhibitor of KinA [Pontibacter ramchanderi]
MKQKDMQLFRLYPLGDSAITVQFGDSIDKATHTKVRAFSAYLDRHPFTGFVEQVPAFNSVTVYYDPWQASEQGFYNPYTHVTEQLQYMLKVARENDKAAAPRIVEIPVCYNGSFGPDLEYVARHTKLSPQEVIASHTRGKYQVYMIGFAPGFPYLGGMAKKLATPRKQNPRPAIPAGSVGIAGNQTGIYPIETPGGWQLIGRTPLRLFDPNREQPSLLQAGDQIRFVAISEKEYWKLKDKAHGA